MMFAMDVDVLADDYFIRFMVDFESDEVQNHFFHKFRDSSISTWNEWNKIIYNSMFDRTKSKIGIDDVDDCISTINEIIQSFYDKTTSDIYRMVNRIDHAFLTVITLPLDDFE